MNWERHITTWMRPDVGPEGDAQHIQNVTKMLGMLTTHELNQIKKHPVIRTRDEQRANPYPAHIATMCQFEPPEKCRLYLGSQGAMALGVGIERWKRSNYHCQSTWKLTLDSLQLHPCTILSRESINDDLYGHQGESEWYTVLVESRTALIDNRESGRAEGTRHLVEFVPRYAIRFAERPYSKDVYARGVFRQAIGLADGIYPRHWLDQ